MKSIASSRGYRKQAWGRSSQDTWGKGSVAIRAVVMAVAGRTFREILICKNCGSVNQTALSLVVFFQHRKRSLCTVVPEMQQAPPRP